MWRKIEWIDKCFFHLNDDSDVIEVANHSISNNIDGHVWVEHKVEEF